LFTLTGQLHAQDSLLRRIPQKDSLHHRIRENDTLHHRVAEKDLTDKLHLPCHHPTDGIRKLTWSVLPAAGYTLSTRGAVAITGNAAFRADTCVDIAGVNTMISTITFSAEYTQNRQFSVPLETSIWTKGNKYNLTGDFHFMKYPQASFGLGTN